MRAALSILGLVIAFAIAVFMMKKQAQQLVVAAPGGAASAAPAVPAPEAVRQKVQGLVDQAAARASEAQP